jgi:hypothetical protein
MLAEEVYFDTTDQFIQLGIAPPHEGLAQRALKRLHRMHMAVRRS